MFQRSADASYQITIVIAFITMDSKSPSPSRERYATRSPTPKSRYSQSPSPSPVRRRRSATRSPSPLPRRNGRYPSESRSPSRDRDDRDDRDDRGRSESPLRGSTKVSKPKNSTFDVAYLIVWFYLQIVVEKLTKTINEEHLQEIFGQYGPIRDLDMPINRQCK